jgi:hypothetical protein
MKARIFRRATQPAQVSQRKEIADRVGLKTQKYGLINQAGGTQGVGRLLPILTVIALPLKLTFRQALNVTKAFCKGLAPEGQYAILVALRLPANRLNKGVELGAS